MRIYIQLGPPSQYSFFSQVCFDLHQLLKGISGSFFCLMPHCVHYLTANFVFLVIRCCAGSITLFHQSFFAQKNCVLKPNMALIRMTRRVKLQIRERCKQSTRLTPHSHSFAVKCISLQMDRNINISMEEKYIFCFHEVRTGPIMNGDNTWGSVLSDG